VEVSGRVVTLARAGLLSRLETTVEAFLDRLARRTQASRTRTHQHRHLGYPLYETDSRTRSLLVLGLLLLLQPVLRRMTIHHHHQFLVILDLLGALPSLVCPTDPYPRMSSRMTSVRTPLPIKQPQSEDVLLHLLVLLSLSAVGLCLMLELLPSNVLLPRSPLARLMCPRSRSLLMTRKSPPPPASLVVWLLVSP
jgi:hypothetical protein